ncbi:MAG: DegT/DnrJ/EryC1/StrS family aminotransferase [Solirubrobacteraceae bacterium]
MDRTTERAEYLKLGAPAIGEEEIDELLDAIRSGWVTTGPKVAVLQERLEHYLRIPHVRCLSSCTAGLDLALRLAGVAPGDEVLVPAMTFASCANVVEHLGAQPVLVDCRPDTGLIDLDHAAAHVSTRTVALMPVHLGGHPVDLDAVNAFRDRHGVAVVEDAAHAIGAEWRGRRIGAHGNPTSFSFHATKNITTFEGGALALADGAAAERVQRLSLHGLSRSAWSRHDTRAPAGYELFEPGLKCAMHDVAAAVGIHQLARLDGWIAQRGQLAGAYDERLGDLPLELPPRPPAHARHAHHLYMVGVREDAPQSRDELLDALHRGRIGASVHFKAIHLFAYYRDRYGLRPADLPVASDRSARALSLPLHPAMTADDVDDVVAVLEEALA